MQTNFTYHQDPSHGWVEVTFAELERLGFADKVSRYSYLGQGVVYLEEDCDAGLLIEAKKARGEAYHFIERHTNGDSFIRRLPRF